MDMAISKDVLNQYSDLQKEITETKEKIDKLEQQITKLEKRIQEIESGEIVKDKVKGGYGFAAVASTARPFGNRAFLAKPSATLIT